MFDPLRSEDDIVNDIGKLNNICQEYKEYKAIWTACAAKFNIHSIEKCECRDYKNNMTFEDRLKCSKCDGIGYIFHFKEEGENIGI